MAEFNEEVLKKWVKKAVDDVLDANDLVRVVHAHWVCERKSDRYSDYHCSNCGNQLKFAYTNIEKEQAEKRHLYCDCCGAKMDAAERKAGE